MIHDSRFKMNVIAIYYDLEHGERRLEGRLENGGSGWMNIFIHELVLVPKTKSPVHLAHLADNDGQFNSISYIFTIKNNTRQNSPSKSITSSEI